MIYDEIYEPTSRDMYFFYRGELKEYMRNHPDLDKDSQRKLLSWVKTGLGNSVHSNPWHLSKDRDVMYDYLDALKIIENYQK